VAIITNAAKREWINILNKIKNKNKGIATNKVEIEEE
jgi:hypothetical protein